jgi:hypothetical protein
VISHWWVASIGSTILNAIRQTERLYPLGRNLPPVDGIHVLLMPTVQATLKIIAKARALSYLSDMDDASRWWTYVLIIVCVSALFNLFGPLYDRRDDNDE